MKAKKHFSIYLIAVMILLILLSNCSVSPEQEKNIITKESVLDEISHVENEVIWEIPEVASLCDEMGFNGKMIDIGDCRLYVEEEGDGVPIVLLHGGPGSTHHGFHPYFSRASKFARVIYYDQRGCGKSEYIPAQGYTVRQAADDLDKLRQKLGIEKWVVLGHSYGGFLAQYYHTLYPENVLGMVIVSGSTGLFNEKLFESRQWDYMSKEERQKIREYGKQIRQRATDENWDQAKKVALQVYNNHLNGDWKRQSFYKPDKIQIARTALYGWKYDFENSFNAEMSNSKNEVNLLGKFKHNPVPTLIMEALWDLTWSEAKAFILLENHPQSEMVVFSRSGHSPFADETEKFMESLRVFVDGLTDVDPHQIERYKKELADTNVGTNDPFIAEKIDETEAKALEKASHTVQQILNGAVFFDQSSPINCHLSYLSSIQHLDPQKARNLQMRNWAKDELEEQRYWLDDTEIWRIPEAPKNPQNGQMWPVYICEKNSKKWSDTLIFIFWKGQWYRLGNMGGPFYNWRDAQDKFRNFFLNDLANR